MGKGGDGRGRERGEGGRGERGGRGGEGKGAAGFEESGCSYCTSGQPLCELSRMQFLASEEPRRNRGRAGGEPSISSTP